MSEALRSRLLGDTLNRESILGLGAHVGGLVLTFILQVLLARLMGAEDYGIYVYVLTWLNLLLLPGRMGLDGATLRFVPAYRGEGRWRLLRGFLRRSRQLVLASSFVVAVAVAAALRLGVAADTPALARTLWLLCPLLPVSALLLVEAARLQSMEKAAASQGWMQVARRAAFLALLGLAVAVPMGAMDALTPPLVLGLYLLASVVTLVAVSLHARSALAEGAGTRESGRSFETGHWIRVALALMLVTGSHMLLNQIDILMVGWLLGMEDAGVYGAATRLATLVLLGLTAVNAVAAPLFSRLHAQGEREELQQVVTKAARAVLAFALPVALILIFMGGTALRIFGAEFAAGSTALAVLAGGQIANAGVGSVGILLTMTGNHGSVARVMGVSAVINAGLNYWLVGLMGIEGAALATTVTTVGWNVALLVVVRRRLDLRATALGVL